MSPRVRKLALAVHLSVSVGWIGAVLGYLALGITAGRASDTQTVRGAWIAMEITGWYVLLPLATAAFVTGVLLALGTRWGLLRHYWVVISLLLTGLALLVLVLHLPSVSTTAEMARTVSAVELSTLGGDVVHPAGGLLVLLVVLALNISKPPGLTRYGQRRRRD